MILLGVQFQSWDKVYDFLAEAEENYLGAEPVRVGDFVVVKTELGAELGKVIYDKEKELSKEELAVIKPILRKGTAEDVRQADERNQNKEEKLEYVREAVKKLNLPMKLVDVHVSFDGSRLTFAFIADGRVDFRELVKDLSRHFGKTIRLRQLGVRDEAQMIGDIGSCGRGLCCKSFLFNLESVSSDYADHQQVAHRGSDRLTGVCGRLKCCLTYEEKLYQELMAKLPAIGSRVRIPEGAVGEVIGWHTLDQVVDVKLRGMKEDDYTIVKVDVKDLSAGRQV